MLTRSSVHWADRIVAQTSWNGDSRSSSQSTSGYSSSSPSMIDRTRAGSGGQPPRRGRRVALVTTFAFLVIFWTILRMSPDTRGGYNIAQDRYGRDARRAGTDSPRSRSDRRAPLPEAVPVPRRDRARRVDGGAGRPRHVDGRQQAEPMRARA